MKKRVDEVKAEKHGGAQANDGLDHGAPPSELGAEARIGRGEREKEEGRADEDEIQHALCSVVRSSALLRPTEQK
ncbi:hypothetical protein DSM21852_23430 [Methylocystis bryophila]|nr:hypothetical protein DSM21852_23430 [Methylocystis bryophila]